MNNCIKEIYQPFSFTQYPPVIQKIFQCQKDVRIIFGTSNGFIIIFNPITLQTQQVAVFKRHIISIQVSQYGNQSQFLVSDGLSWKYIDYLTLQMQEANFPNATFFAQFQEDQRIIVNPDGAYYFNKAILFKKKNDQQAIISRKLQLYAQFVDNILFTLNDASQLTATNLNNKQDMMFAFINDEGTFTQEFLNPPCSCGCFPQISFNVSSIIISWHNKIFIIKNNDDTDLSCKTLPVSCCLVLQQQLVFSSILFENSIYVLTDGDTQQLRQYSLNCELISEIQLQEQTFGFDIVKMNRVKRYLPASDHRPEATHIILLQKDNILLYNFQTQLDHIILQINNYYQLCTNLLNDRSQQNQEEIIQIIGSLQKNIIEYNEVYKLTQFFSILESSIQVLLQVQLYQSAQNMFEYLLIQQNDQFNFFKKYVPLFSTYGVIELIISHIPDPLILNNDNQNFYRQLMDSLLLTDYSIFFKLVRYLHNVYDTKYLIKIIKQRIGVQNPQSTSHKLDQIYLNQSLIYLYEYTQDFQRAFTYILEIQIFNQEQLINYVINHELYTTIFNQLEKFEKNKIFNIISSLLPKIIYDSQLFNQAINSLLYIDTTHFLTLESYCLSKYYQSDLMKIKSLNLDENLQNYLKLILSLYDQLDYNHVRYFLILNEQKITTLNSILSHIPQDQLFMQTLITNVKSNIGNEINNKYTKFIANFILQLDFKLPKFDQVLNQIKQYLPDLTNNGHQMNNYKFLQTSANSVLKTLYLIINYNHQNDIKEAISLNTQEGGIIFTLNQFHAFGIRITDQFLFDSLQSVFESGQSISLLDGALRARLPIQKLLGTSVGDTIVADFLRELSFFKAGLQLICEDENEKRKLFQNCARKGILCEKQCVQCSKQAEFDGICFSCGCFIHGECMKQFQQSCDLNEEQVVCPQCNQQNDIDAIKKDQFGWYQVL